MTAYRSHRAAGVRTCAAPRCDLTCGFACAPTEHERAALERAISPDFLDGEGWAESKNGAVKKENGRTIFDSGFTKAIRKVLDAAKPRA